MAPHGFDDVEITVSFRRRSGHLECAFLSVLATEGRGQRTVVASKHLTGSDEALCDRAAAEVREHILEHVLAAVEPF